MKKIFFISFIIILAIASKVKAQPNIDTLAVLQTIVVNKSQFVGQPFSKLLDSLKIQIKYFSPFGSLPYDMNKETSSSFSFYFPQSSNEMYLTYPKLRVSWYPFLNGALSETLFGYFGGGWTPNVKTFYSTGVVADIEIRD
ncbi:MAG: hypothetical protein H7Y86_10355 [Rhizobacter sp.]|nr:hypothetical protein [Ferruginibacter sp.]